MTAAISLKGSSPSVVVASFAASTLKRAIKSRTIADSCLETCHAVQEVRPLQIPIKYNFKWHTSPCVVACSVLNETLKNFGRGVKVHCQLPSMVLINERESAIKHAKHTISLHRIICCSPNLLTSASASLLMSRAVAFRRSSRLGRPCRACSKSCAACNPAGPCCTSRAANSRVAAVSCAPLQPLLLIYCGPGNELTFPCNSDFPQHSNLKK